MRTQSWLLVKHLRQIADIAMTFVKKNYLAHKVKKLYGPISFGNRRYAEGSPDELKANT